MEVQNLEDKIDKFINQIDNLATKKRAEIKKKEILEHYKGEDAVISFQEIFDEEVIKPDKIKISTGYYNLDEDMDGGFEAGDLVLLGGFSGNGKTNFAFNMTAKMERLNPFWLPFEETAEEYARKLIKWKQNPTKFYVPRNMIREDIDWIEERILEATLKFNSKVVFIDNLHFITMSENDKEYWGKLGSTAKRLKKLAQKLDVCIVLIVHLRKTQLGVNKMPTIDDISGSSDVAKVSNTILILWRESTRNGDGKLEFTGNNFVGIQKCRAGAKQDNHLFAWEKGKFLEKSLAELTRTFNKNKREDLV